MKPNALPKQGLKTDPPRTATLLEQTRQQLQPVTDSPLLDALVLLSFITQSDKSHLLANPDLELTAAEQSQLSSTLDALISGTPLPYVLGEWEFRGLRFQVDPRVLIPRPESEGLVERVLAWSTENPGPRTGLELGTGSGCIAISLALARPNHRITATDVSYPSLRLAQQNAARHRVADRVDFVQADLIQGLALKVDFIAANLPYIPSATLAQLTGIHREPQLALDGGPDGLVFIRRALPQAVECIKPGGLLVLEIDENCGEGVRQLAEKAFPLALVKVEQDLAGMDRYLVVKL